MFSFATLPSPLSSAQTLRRPLPHLPVILQARLKNLNDVEKRLEWDSWERLEHALNAIAKQVTVVSITDMCMPLHRE